MQSVAVWIPVLLLGLAAPAVGQAPNQEATPAARAEALRAEFDQTARGLYLATTDAERQQVAARMAGLSLRVLAQAEQHPDKPTTLDLLVQVVTQEVWLENNTSFPGRGPFSPERRALALLLRDHLQSDRLGEACRRVMYGFSRDCETFLRTVLEKSPHREVQALACLRLAQFLKLRSRRLELLQVRPDMAARYRRLFGSEYLNDLKRRDPAKAAAEVEALFERAGREFGELKLPYEGTVGEKARAELHEIRHLSVGKEAPEIEGEDQDGRSFKLSDYRGKVVLLYFWSEY